MMKKNWQGYLALLVAGLSLACGDAVGRHSGAGPIVRDSAGITIAESDQPIWGEGQEWHLSETPELEIGLVDGPEEYQLFQVLSVTRLDNGTIVVANSGSHEIRFYDSHGRFITQVGRQGDGPGEFQQLHRVGTTAGDTVVAWDPQLKRLTYFAPDGELVRVVSPGPITGVFPEVRGLFSDGSVILTNGFQPHAVLAAGNRVQRDSTIYLYFDPSGTLIDTVGRYPGTERYAAVESSGGQSGSFTVRDLPFGRRTLSAAGGLHLYIGTGDRYEIGEYSRSGELKRLIRVPHPIATVSDSDIRQYIAAEVQAAGVSGDERRQLEATLREVPYPGTMPAYAGLEVDREGNLWVQAARRPGNSGLSRWTIFDADGRMLGTVDVPARLSVHEIGSDWILGTTFDDEIGVERVQLYSLRKP